VLVWRQYKWLTRIVAFGPAGKALSLCWRQGRLMSGAAAATDAAGEAANRLSLGYDWFFLGVAIVTAVMLFWAGWGQQRDWRAA
jgi:hypothetical protein